MILKTQIQQLLATALEQLQIALPAGLSIHIDRTKEKQHGDFSSNIALLLGHSMKIKPYQLAQRIVQQLNVIDSDQVPWHTLEIAGPGFINFFLKSSSWYPIISDILQEKESYGHSNLGQGKKVLVEFVSANPTGPLHVGHGRSAAYGDAIVRLLRISGYCVHAEYYVNDAGRQMDILALSVWLRYLQECGEKLDFPSNAYRGDYIYSLVQQVQKQFGSKLRRASEQIFADIPADEPAGGDKEIHIDALIQRAKLLLDSNYHTLHRLSTDALLTGIRDDLTAFNVQFDQWFSEAQLFTDASVQEIIERLKNKGFTYEESGALWFKSSAFGDEKDRVLLRENGQPTYFAADAAYRLNILHARGFQQNINILGADHHGYVPRIRAVIRALGYSDQMLTALLVQFAVLYRGKERVSMSTRSGEFITLRALCEEVGSDAARFFYVMRKVQQHMDFDLELAKSQSNENPVYYIHYAHARICSVLRQLSAKQLIFDLELGLRHLHCLVAQDELDLLIGLSRYTETLQQAVCHYEPHLLAHYLRELAQLFHSYYNHHVFLIEEAGLRNARLCLIIAVQQIIRNGLNLLGVQAPEIM